MRFLAPFSSSSTLVGSSTKKWSNACPRPCGAPGQQTPPKAGLPQPSVGAGQKSTGGCVEPATPDPPGSPPQKPCGTFGTGTRAQHLQEKKNILTFSFKDASSSISYRRAAQAMVQVMPLPCTPLRAPCVDQSGHGVPAMWQNVRDTAHSLLHNTHQPDVLTGLPWIMAAWRASCVHEESTSYEGSQNSLMLVNMCSALGRAQTSSLRASRPHSTAYIGALASAPTYAAMQATDWSGVSMLEKAVLTDRVHCFPQGS